jgi:hypothetical protein
MNPVETTRIIKRCVRAIFALSLISSRPAAAQPQQPPAEITAAQAQFQAEDFKGAITTLEAFHAKNPTSLAGLQILGDSYRRTGNLDKALEVHVKDSQSRPGRLRGSFNAAVIHVLKGDNESALRALRVLRESGSYDLDLVKANADLVPLKSDPRFNDLFFKPADFVEPFVEPVRIVHEWRGENKGDIFGWIARSLGDVDGDDVSDIVTSAAGFTIEGQAAGKVYVYSGKTGRLLWSKIGEKGEGLGTGLESAGDVNGDGVRDVIAGSPSVGKAYVFEGRTGRLLWALSAGDPGAGFGRGTSFAGDQDGDGCGDVIVGAPGAAGSSTDPGHAYVFSGKTGKLMTTLKGESAGDGFGSIVAGSRDPKHPFLIVGAPAAGPVNTGRAYVYGGMDQPAKFVIDNEDGGVALGFMFVSVVGDTNKDGTPDIYASDWSSGTGGPATGRVFVHSGADGRRLLTFGGEGPGEGFGIGSADVGDVNGDGHDDLLLGAWQHRSAAMSGGRLHVLSGRDGSLLRRITGKVPGETLGFDATGVGDVTGDGVPDYLVTSAYSQVNGFQSGRVFILAGDHPVARAGR